MIDAAVRSVLQTEGPASFVTVGTAGPHLVATWQSYLTVVDDATIAFPAGGYRVTESNLAANPRLEMIVGARGGTATGAPLGFRLTGTAELQVGTPIFNQLKARFAWCRAAVVMRVDKVEKVLG